MSEGMRVNSARWAVVRLILLALFVAAAVVVGLLLPPLDVDAVREGFSSSGWGGAALFAIVYAAATLTPVPKGLLNVAAGVVWGFASGVVIVYVGAILGAGAAFWIARGLGREAVTRLIGRRAASIDDLLARRGFLAILGLRLVPIVPFTALNYASGLTGVRFRDYAVATVLGIIPGTAAYVALGAFGVEAGPAFWIALAVLGTLSLVGAIVGVRMRRGRAARSAAASDPDSAGPEDA